MADLPTLSLHAESAHLLRLQRGIISVGILWDGQDEADKSAVQFDFIDGPAIVVAADFACSGRPGDVFTLRIAPPDGLWDGSFPEWKMQPWNFARWTVDVLERLEWSLRLPDNLAEWADLDFSWLAPGQVPPGAEPIAIVGVGLLFTDEGGNRLLVGTGDSPMSMVVSREETAIDLFLATCHRAPASDYAVQRLRDGR
jgi:hypothetical protein